MQENLLAVLGEQLRREFEGVLTTHATDWLAPITSGTFFLPALEADSAELLQTIDAWMALIEWLTSGFFPEDLAGWETAVSPPAASSISLPDFELSTNPVTSGITSSHSAPATPLARQRRVLALHPPANTERVIADPVADTPVSRSNSAVAIAEPTTSQTGSSLLFRPEAQSPNASSAAIIPSEKPLDETRPQFEELQRQNTLSPLPKQPHNIAGVLVGGEQVESYTLVPLTNSGLEETTTYRGAAPFRPSNQPALTEQKDEEMVQSQGEWAIPHGVVNNSTLTRWSNIEDESEVNVLGMRVKQPTTESVVENLIQSKQSVVEDKPQTLMAKTEWEKTGVKGLRDFAALLQTAVSPSSTPNNASQFISSQPHAPTEQTVREAAPGQKTFSLAPPQPQVVRPSLQTNPSATSGNPLKAAQPNSLTNTAVWDDSNIAGTLSSDELAQFEQVTNPFWGLQDRLLSNSAQTQEEQDLFTQAEGLTQPLSGHYPVEIEQSGDQRIIPPTHRQIQTAVKKPTFSSSGLEDWQLTPQPILRQEWGHLIQDGEVDLFESPSPIQADQSVENVVITPSRQTPVKGLRELANLVQDSFAKWQNITTVATTNPRESFATSQISSTHQETSHRKGRKQHNKKRKPLRSLQPRTYALWPVSPPIHHKHGQEIGLSNPVSSEPNSAEVKQPQKNMMELLASSPQLTTKERESPAFSSSPTTSEGSAVPPMTTPEITSTTPLATISEPDIDLILEALAQEIQREYKRFYG